MRDHMGMVRREGETGAVHFERHYDATLGEMWAALTQPAQLAAWITPNVTFEARPGGRVVFAWGDGSTVAGTVRVCEPPHVLEYTWHEGKAETVVRFELRADGQRTLLLLDHRGLPLGDASGFGAGWHSHLDWLSHHLNGTAEGFDQNGRYQELTKEYPAVTA